MHGQSADYLSYLLRLWRVRERGTSVWRGSLQSPQSGERVSFATLDELLAYLWDKMGLTPEPEDARLGRPAGQEGDAE